MNDKIRTFVRDHFLGHVSRPVGENPTELTDEQVLGALKSIADIGHHSFGVGDKADAKASRTQRFGTGESFEIIYGQHGHSYSSTTWYARFPDGSIEEFDGHHVRHKIEIWEENYLKSSGLSGNEIRKLCGLKIWIDDELAYEGAGGRTWEHAMADAKKFLARLQEPHAWDGYWTAEGKEKLKGRKVFWRGTPAVVKYVFSDQACVVLECVDGAFPLSPCQQEDLAKSARLEREGGPGAAYYELSPDETERKTVKAEVWDSNISWYREEVRGKEEVEA